MSDLWFDGAVLIALTCASGIFSGAETALTAMTSMRVRRLLARNRRRYERLLKWERRPRQMLATILIGNNVVNIAASSMATLFSMRVLQQLIGPDVTGETAVVVATGAMTLIVVVFGEITPKTVAATFPEPIALRVVGPLDLLRRLLGPLVWLTSVFARALVWVLGRGQGTPSISITEGDVRDLIRAGLSAGAILPFEEKMTRAVLRLDDRNARDIMVPRTSMATVEADASIEEAISLAVRTGHSRIPVVGSSTDDVVGVLFVKDLLRLVRVAVPDDIRVRHVARPAVFIPGTIRLDLLLERMRTERIHLAVVLDEYGGVDGLVTLEDLLEEIVGSIQDEHDPPETLPRMAGGDDIEVDGATPLVDVERLLDISFEGVTQDSLGGWISAELGHIPEEGEVACAQGWRFEVLAADRRHVRRVRIRRALEQDPPGDPPDPRSPPTGEPAPP